MRSLLILGLVLIPLPLGLSDAATVVGPQAATGPAPPPATNDYPTAARADYVFACMNENGGTEEALQKCSCAIDVIASLLPYKNYEQADTVLRMQRTTGYLADEFRTDVAKTMVRRLWESQAEATVRCF
jgi:hypothetical protein